MLTYWDTGCVAKLYVEEPASPEFQRLAAHSEGPLASSELLLAEFRFALWRMVQAAPRCGLRVLSV